MKENGKKIVIFDCHGTHLRKAECGTLIIGNDYFNIWEHKFDFHVPEIVIFSACDTHPIHGGNASIANGFLLAGSKAVIATNTTIDAMSSATFIARLLYRINDYFPAILSYRGNWPVAWIEFFSGIQKMLFATEVIQYYGKNDQLGRSIIIKLGIEANNLINRCNINWIEQLYSLIGSAINKDGKTIYQEVIKSINFSDSLRYICLGNADRVFINFDKDT